LLHEDNITFALRLAQIRLQGRPDELDADEFEFLLRGGEGIVTRKLTGNYTGLLNATQQKMLAELLQLTPFKNLEQKIGSKKDEWSSFIASSNAENSVPACWEPKEGTTGKYFCD
jgi:hypothetical protein